MEPERDKLCRDLRRYRFLVSEITDAPVAKTLAELIREAQARLRAIERQEATRRGAARDSRPDRGAGGIGDPAAWATKWRLQAEKCRALADRMTHVAARDTCWSMADVYDELAELWERKARAAAIAPSSRA